MKNIFKKIVMATVIAAIGSSATACSTVSSSNLSAAAPIVYKGDQAGLNMASSYHSFSGPTSVTPKSYETPKSYVQTPVMPVAPQVKPQSNLPIVPARPAPIQQAPVQQAPIQQAPVQTPSAPVNPGLDTSKVDSTLYANQRIGKPYTIMGKTYTPKHQPDYDKTGTASWYGDKFHGKLTASGEVYDMNDVTAAHKTLPLNSMVYVTNVENGKGMMVRINDRGPFIGDRIIDLSRETARQLGLFDSGLAKVRVQYAGPADPMAKKQAEIARPVDRAQPVEKPNVVAEAPAYRPLRSLPSAPRVDTPHSVQTPAPVDPIAPYSAPNNSTNPLLNGVPRPYNPVATAPALPPKPNSDSPVSLTIKGPVHLASEKHKASDKSTAKFIPAVNYRTVPSK